MNLVHSLTQNFLRSVLIISSNLCLPSPNYHSHSGHSANIFCMHLMSPTYALQLAHLILLTQYTVQSINLASHEFVTTSGVCNINCKAHHYKTLKTNRINCTCLFMCGYSPSHYTLSTSNTLFADFNLLFNYFKI